MKDFDTLALIRRFYDEVPAGDDAAAQAFFAREFPQMSNHVQRAFLRESLAAALADEMMNLKENRT